MNGNLSLTIPFLTTIVNVNSTAFWYSLTGVIGLASVSAFIYFFKQTTLVNGTSYPSPNMKVKIEGTTTANVNITLLFRNLHLLAVLRQIRNCDFHFEAVGFDWCDVSNVTTVFNPVFNATVLSVTFIVPVGTFKIDPTTIGTSTSVATSNNNQRKVFFCQTRYWAFYSDGTNEVWRTSLDGTTWTSTTTVRAGTTAPSLSTWNDCPNTKIYYVYAPVATTFQHRAGTLNTDGTITWDYAEMSKTTATANAYGPTIVKSTDSKLYAAMETVSASTGGRITVYVCTISGTNCGTNTNWVSSLDINVNAVTTTQQSLSPTLAPLTATKLSLVYVKPPGGGQLGIRTFTGSAWNSEVIATSGIGNPKFSTIAISDTTHFAGVIAGGTVIYWNCAYPCSSAPTETTITSTTIQDNAVISSNNNQEIIVSYAIGGVSTSIFYKVSTNGGTSFGAEQTLVSSESVRLQSLSITYTKQNNCYEFLWTSNSGFNVRFQCLTTVTNFIETVSATLALAPTLKQDITTKESATVSLVATLLQAISSTFSTTISLTATLRQDITTLLSATISLVANINAIQATIVIQQALPLLIGAIIVAFTFIGILLPGRRRRR